MFFNSLIVFQQSYKSALRDPISIRLKINRPLCKSLPQILQHIPPRPVEIIIETVPFFTLPPAILIEIDFRTVRNDIRKFHYNLRMLLAKFLKLRRSIPLKRE